ncbi:MAG: iron-containing alcohol dehydrogenase family protein, partial [Cetobacterium sp.]
SIFDSLTQIKRVEKEHLHGEVVAFGILVQLELEKKFEELEKLKAFYEKIKLPTKLNEIVIKEEYLKKKDAVIDKILDSAAYSDIPLNFTRDEFLAVLEKNI